MKHRVPGPLDLPRHGLPASGGHPRNAVGRSLGLAVGTSGGKYHGPGVGRIDATCLTHCGWKKSCTKSCTMDAMDGWNMLKRLSPKIMDHNGINHLEKLLQDVRMSQPSTWQLKCCIKFGWDEFVHQMEVDVRMYIWTMDQMACGHCVAASVKKKLNNWPETCPLPISLSMYIYLSLSIYLCVCVFSQQFGIWAQYNPNITLISVEEVVISQINQNDLAVTSL